MSRKKLVSFILLSVFLGGCDRAETGQYEGLRYLQDNIKGNVTIFNKISIAGNALYFINPDDNNKIYTMNDQNEEIVFINKRAKNISMEGEWLYYGLQDSLESLNLKTRAQIQLSHSPAEFIGKMGSSIFFVSQSDDENMLMKFDAESGQSIEVMRGQFDSLTIKDNHIYFRNRDDNWQLWMLDVSTNHRDRVIPFAIRDYSIEQDSIYYIAQKDSFIYKLRKQEIAHELVIASRAKGFQVNDNLLYFIKEGSNGDQLIEYELLNKTNRELSHKEELAEIYSFKNWLFYQGQPNRHFQNGIQLDRNKAPSEIQLLGK